MVKLEEGSYEPRTRQSSTRNANKETAADTCAHNHNTARAYTAAAWHENTPWPVGLLFPKGSSVEADP